MASSNMVVQNNILAMNVHRNMKGVGIQQSKATEKLSSGYRINTAADDATGLAISEKMRAQIRGLNMASKNVSDAVSLIKTAEGGMQGIDDMIHRIRELVDYAANDTNENNDLGTGDRQKIQDEIDQLTKEIDDMSERVEFNKKKLINGTFQDTKAQLANAKATYDRTSLDVVTAEAMRDSVQALLGPADGSDSTTAYGELKTAQDVLDGTGAGSIAQYKTDVTTFAAAQAAYDAARNEYNDALAQFNIELEKSGVGTVTSLEAKHITPGDPALVGNAGALGAALERYIVAAEALGMDALQLDAANTSSGSGDGKFAGFLTELIKTYTSADVTTLQNYGKNMTEATGGKLITGKAIDTYQTAVADFATAEASYNSAVAARDTAQTKVNNLNEQLTENQRKLNAANTIFNAADVSYQAAQALNTAGTSKALHFQVGANANQSLIMSIGSLKSDTLGIGDGKGKSYINVVKNSGQDITATIDVLDQALSYVTTERSKLGAAQNRMEYTQSSLDITSENISDAESRIRDTDMAKEMMNFTKAQILQQVSTAMMAQANQVPQSVLQLLR